MVNIPPVCLQQFMEGMFRIFLLPRTGDESAFDVLFLAFDVLTLDQKTMR